MGLQWHDYFRTFQLLKPIGMIFHIVIDGSKKKIFKSEHFTKN